MFHIGNFKTEAKQKGGWFIGHFMDHNRRSEDIEIKYWEFEADRLPEHNPKYQKQSWEITLILKGKIEGVIEGERIKLEAGEYIMIPPHIKSGFPDKVIEGVEGITIKFPSILDDTVKLSK